MSTLYNSGINIEQLWQNLVNEDSLKNRFSEIAGNDRDVVCEAIVKDTREKYWFIPIRPHKGGTKLFLADS